MRYFDISRRISRQLAAAVCSALLIGCDDDTTASDAQVAAETQVPATSAESVGISTSREPSPSPSVATSITAAPPLAESIDGRSFVARSLLIDGVLHPAWEDREIRLSFHSSTAQVESCNTFTTSYIIDDDTLVSTSSIESTAILCEGLAAAQDDALAVLLLGSPAVILSGNDLVLSSDRVTFGGTDEAVSHPSYPLLGTTWSYVQALGAVLAPYQATLQIGVDGSVVFTGCQTVSGTATVDASALILQIGEPAGDACATSSMDATEAEVLRLLSVYQEFELTGNVLTLGSLEGGLQFQAVP